MNTKQIKRYLQMLQPYRKVVFVFVLIGIASTLFFLLRGIDRQTLEVVFFDVGQGDAALIRTPLGSSVLIDTGANYIASQKLESYSQLLAPSLTTLILTHPDLDHVGGADDVVEGMLTRHIITSASGEYSQYGVEPTPVDRGDRLVLSKGDKQDITLEVLSPTVGMVGDSNHTSVVARFVYGNFEYLFMADADAEVERRLVAEGVIDKSHITILKLGHHGSKTSSSELFLKTLRPEYCIVSAGKNNSYGHPHPEVVERLEKHCGVVYRTDEDGDISTRTDGKHFWVDYGR